MISKTELPNSDMRFSLLTACYLHVLGCSAQSAEVNKQVWIPFIKSFNNRDTEAFMSVHSKDVVRSPRDARSVWNWTEYYQQQERNDEHEKASKYRRSLELRFTERIYGNDNAVEVGIYKTTYTQPDGATRSFYGRFHVVLRKEDGTWKILVDTDSSEGESITEDDFLKGKPIE